MEKECNQVYNHLISKDIEIHIIIVEWVFSLFSSVIPIELQIEFYFGFFADGWEFFYKMCIAIILTIDFEKNEYIEVDEIYLLLKFGKHDDQYEKNTLKFWKNIIWMLQSISVE